jgi:hypothetical protein
VSGASDTQRQTGDAKMTDAQLMAQGIYDDHCKDTGRDKMERWEADFRIIDAINSRIEKGKYWGEIHDYMMREAWAWLESCIIQD